MKLERIGFAYNPTNPAAVELRDRAGAWCKLRDLAWWSSEAGSYDEVVAELPRTDVLVVLGGDGTFLRAARAVAEVDVPILGVNLGKVGFLSKVEAHELEAGSTIEGERFVALNEVVVARGELARVVRLDVAVGPSHVATFIADGLVVSTPTGSTGYSFSAGGPIVDPLSRNLIVTPIAAYLAAIRSVVVGPKQVVRIRVVDAKEALVSVDGREDRHLRVGDVVEVRALDASIRLIEPKGAQPFWDLLRHKVELLPS